MNSNFSIGVYKPLTASTVFGAASRQPATLNSPTLGRFKGLTRDEEYLEGYKSHPDFVLQGGSMRVRLVGNIHSDSRKPPERGYRVTMTAMDQQPAAQATFTLNGNAVEAMDLPAKGAYALQGATTRVNRFFAGMNRSDIAFHKIEADGSRRYRHSGAYVSDILDHRAFQEPRADEPTDEQWALSGTHTPNRGDMETLLNMLGSLPAFEELEDETS